MMKHCRDFEDDYKACNGVFVLMGDASCAAVAGYGLCPMIIDSNVTRVLNSLHVPDLDSNLFSVTKHGCMDYGHSFILEGGNMHLLFPEFSITQPIPENNNLRVSLQPMSADDWNIPSYILDRDNISNDYLNNYKNRINMLNGISKGKAVTTCTNRKLQVDVLKRALGLKHVRDSEDAHNDNNDDFNSSSNRDFDVTRDSSSADNNNHSSSDLTKGLPEKCLLDKYFCEGSPNKIMMEALKELNINEIKEFLMAGGPEETEQSEKENARHLHNCHLESSRGGVKDQLTTYQIQSYIRVII